MVTWFDLKKKPTMRNQNPSLHLITELSVSLVDSLFFFFFSFQTARLLQTMGNYFQKHLKDS